MPNDTTQSQQPQVPPQDSSQSHSGVNPEKMLIEMLKQIEQEIAELGQRVDVLEQNANIPLNP